MKNEDSTPVKRLLIYGALNIVLCHIFQLTGVNGIKAPMTYIIYDVMIWALLGLVIFPRLKLFPHLSIMTVLILMLFSPFKNINQFLTCHETSAIPLYQYPLQECIHEDGSFRQSAIEDPLARDAVSSYYGLRVKFNESNKSWMNYRFLNTKP